MPPNPDLLRANDEAIDEPPEEPTDYQGDVSKLVDPEEDKRS